MLVGELRCEIPKLIETSHGFINDGFDASDPLVIRYVKYDLDINELFWDYHPYLELFRKRPEYKNQREARIIIPSISFLFNPITSPEYYFANELNVPVPTIKDYAIVVHAKQCDTVEFENFNEDLSHYDITFYNRK